MYLYTQWVDTSMSYRERIFHLPLINKVRGTFPSIIFRYEHHNYNNIFTANQTPLNKYNVTRPESVSPCENAQDENSEVRWVEKMKTPLWYDKEGNFSNGKPHFAFHTRKMAGSDRLKAKKIVHGSRCIRTMDMMKAGHKESRGEL